MAHFLAQVAYSPEGWQALVKNPQNRIEAVRPAIEKLGGKIDTAYFAFGEYDVVVIFQMPENVNAAAFANRGRGGGRLQERQDYPPADHRRSRRGDEEGFDSGIPGSHSLAAGAEPKARCHKAPNRSRITARAM